MKDKKLERRHVLQGLALLAPAAAVAMKPSEASAKPGAGAPRQLTIWELHQRKTRPS